MGLFDKIKKGLQKTSDAVSRSLDAVFAGFVTIDDDLLEELDVHLLFDETVLPVCEFSPHPASQIRTSLPDEVSFHNPKASFHSV